MCTKVAVRQQSSIIYYTLIYDYIFKHWYFIFVYFEGASKELATIVEGESMLNDGAAIVLFKVFKVMAASGSRFGGNG